MQAPNWKWIAEFIDWMRSTEAIEEFSFEIREYDVLFYVGRHAKYLTWNWTSSKVEGGLKHDALSAFRKLSYEIKDEKVDE